MNNETKIILECNMSDLIVPIVMRTMLHFNLKVNEEEMIQLLDEIKKDKKVNEGILNLIKLKNN